MVTNSVKRWVLCLIILGIASDAFAQFGNSPMGGGGGPPGPRGDQPQEYRPPVFEKRERGEPVVAVKILGNKVLDESKIRVHLQTREGRDFDPEVVRADVRRLSTTGMFQNVRTYRRPVEGGIEVTF
jgi:outer membrane protein assembly factor BamA